MRRKTAVRAAFLLVAVTLLVLVVVREREGLAAALDRMTLASAGLAAVMVLLGLLAQMMSWRALLGSPTAGPALRAAGHIYFVGQLGKYLPGSVWAVVAQTELSLEHSIPRARSAVAAIAAMVVLVVTGTAVGVILLVAGSVDSLRENWWALLAVPAGLLLLWPPVFDRAVGLALRIARHDGEAPSLSTPALLRSGGWALAMWLAFGGHAWVLGTAMGAPAGAFGTFAGAFALAWVVGFLVVLAPAGAGPREAALVLALAPVMQAADALALALVSRVIMVIGDGVLAAAFARRSHRRERSAASAEGTQDLRPDA